MRAAANKKLKQKDLNLTNPSSKMNCRIRYLLNQESIHQDKMEIMKKLKNRVKINKKRNKGLKTFTINNKRNYMPAEWLIQNKKEKSKMKNSALKIFLQNNKNSYMIKEKSI